MAPTVGVVANFQVSETLKILTGNYDRVNRSLLNFDLWSNELMQLKVTNVYENGDCPCCKHRQFDFLDGKAGSSAAVLCGRNAVQLRHRQQAGSIDIDAIANRLREHGEVTTNDFMLRASIASQDASYEITLFPDGRAIIKGTDDPAVARSVYSKFVGA